MAQSVTARQAAVGQRVVAGAAADAEGWCGSGRTVAGALHGSDAVGVALDWLHARKLQIRAGFGGIGAGRAHAAFRDVGGGHWVVAAFWSAAECKD